MKQAQTRLVGLHAFAVLLAAALWFGLALPAQAQTGGQFCVRAFEDRNENGLRDPNEPLLTRDVVVNLLDGDGVTVASGVLENSPTAAQGILCFQRLPAGQYSAVVTSADFTPTTPTTFSAAVSESGQPVVVEFGGQRIDAAPIAPPPAADDSSDLLLRVGLALGSALCVTLGMVLLGVLIYVAALRRPPTRPAGMTTTGLMRAVEVSGAPESSSTDDTGPVRRV
jgi:hypothetical protein